MALASYPFLRDTRDGTWVLRPKRRGGEFRKTVVWGGAADDAEAIAPGRRLFDSPALYEPLFGWDAAAEINFVIGAAGAGSPNVIEFGCGAGRLLLPLLDRGIHVDGIDASGPSLLWLRRRCVERGHRPQLVLGDLCETTILGEYDLGVCALNTLRYLPGTAAIAAHLRRAALALRPGGTYLLHLDTYGSHRASSRGAVGDAAEWQGFGRRGDELRVRWELAERVPRDGFELEIERVRVWDRDRLAVDEYQYQVAMSIHAWLELFAADQLWTVVDVTDADSQLRVADVAHANSGNHWIRLRRTTTPPPPLLAA